MMPLQVLFPPLSGDGKGGGNTISKGHLQADCSCSEMGGDSSLKRWLIRRVKAVAVVMPETGGFGKQVMSVAKLMDQLACSAREV